MAVNDTTETRDPAEIERYRRVFGVRGLTAQPVTV